MAPRWEKPLTRRQKKFRTYAAAFGVAFSLFYFFSRPTDYLAMPFETHSTYMNDRSNVDGFVAKGSFDWREAPTYYKHESYTALPTGTPKNLPPIQYNFPPETSSQRKIREKRRVAVRDEFLRSWKSYKRVAWGRDELMPVSGKGLDTFGAWGATLVDTLDTLWIMGLKKEFYEAVEAVAGIDFGKSEMINISVFETTIRYLGGLLSAYDLSHEKALLDKAVQLGELLYRAFDNKEHMPLDRLSIEGAKDGDGFISDSSICVAAVGSLTMEFTRLAQITQNNKFYDAVARVTDVFDQAQNSTAIPGLFPIWMNARKQDLSYDRSFTLGAMADSAFEYFPKTYALLGGLEPVYQKLYEDSAAPIDKYMLFRPMLPDGEGGEDILIAGNVHADRDKEVSLDPEMQHLTCFIGGYFALAGRLFKNAHHVDLGAKLTKGCIYAYHAMPTGIMPEIFDMVACDSRKDCPWNQTKWEEAVVGRSGQSISKGNPIEHVIEQMKVPPGFTSLRDKRYLLRPEAIESVWVLYRITGHEEYADHAWKMFTSIRKHTSTLYGNGQSLDVTNAGEYPEIEDKMESFWLAETLKYFYLVFSEPDMISLDEWVLNTEAHPFRRPI